MSKHASNGDNNSHVHYSTASVVSDQVSKVDSSATTFKHKTLVKSLSNPFTRETMTILIPDTESVEMREIPYSYYY